MGHLHVPADRLRTHQLPREAFDELRSGAVTEKFIAIVDGAQYSRRKLLLRALADSCAAHRETAGPLTDVETLWTILSDAEERAPDVVREIVTYPTVGVWAGRTLRRLYGHAPDSIPIWSEFGYFHSLVAAAAARTGLPCVIRLPVVRGFVTLPTVGQFRVPTSFPAGFVDLHVSSQTVVVCSPNGTRLAELADGPHFFPARRHLTASRGFHLSVEINDTDPYREFSEPIPPQRLDSLRFAEWAKMLDEAFDILTLWHPGYARELTAGLRVLTPLAADGIVRGASSSVAFGCVAASEKNSATALAETLVHEFQHSKVNGLLSLFDVGEQENMYAPWRDDPRPLSGLLHGIFAFLSVAEFWQVQRDLVPEQERGIAEFTFALRRHQVDEAVRSLLHHPALTTIGNDLVEGVHTRLSVIRRRPVSPELAGLVTMITDDHRASWRMRHVRPDPRDVARLTSAWLTGSPAHRVRPHQIVPSPHKAGRSARRDLLELKATDPATFASVIRRSTATPADVSYVSGDPVAATTAYLTHLHNAAEDAGSWVGLGLSLRAQGIPAAGILDAPETIIAVYKEVLAQTGSAPDPLRLADWLGDALAGAE